MTVSVVVVQQSSSFLGIVEWGQKYRSCCTSLSGIGSDILTACISLLVGLPIGLSVNVRQHDIFVVCVIFSLHLDICRFAFLIKSRLVHSRISMSANRYFHIPPTL